MGLSPMLVGTYDMSHIKSKERGVRRQQKHFGDVAFARAHCFTDASMEYDNHPSALC